MNLKPFKLEFKCLELQNKKIRSYMKVRMFISFYVEERNEISSK